MGRPVIVVAEAYDATAIGKLAAAGAVRVLSDASEAALIATVADADALLVRTYAAVTARVIAAAPKLRVIGRGGVGLENIDTAAAAAHGITIVYTPAAATRSVAELTVGMILSLERRMCAGDAAVRGGRFAQARQALQCRELGELTLGVVGFGRIGRAVGRICHTGLGMNVLYNDIVETGWLDFVATPVSKQELWAGSDVISLHVPLTGQTRQLIDREVLGKLRPDALLINTSRGAVIDAAAVADALRGGRLAGAAIDVFDPEPPPPDHPLLSAPNVLLSPHTGARSTAGLARMNDAVDDVIAVLAGRPPKYAYEPAL